MANTNIYQVKKTINGKEYIAQFNGIGAALEAVDSCYIEGTGNTSLVKMAAYIFDNVIVEPKKLTANDFASMEELNAVTSWAREVMHGKFRPAEDTGSAKEAGRK